MRRSEGSEDHDAEQGGSHEETPRKRAAGAKNAKSRNKKASAKQAAAAGHVRLAPRKKRASHTKHDEGVSVKLSDLPIVTSRRWYLTLSTVIGIVGSIVSSTYFVVDYGRIKPIEKDFAETKILLTNAQAEVQIAKSLLERSEQKSTALAANLERPGQIFPPDRSSIVGLNISFVWDYGKHDNASSRYIIELQDLKEHGATVKLNADRPETKSMFHPFDRAAAGSYVWRVRPGVMVGGAEVAQGPWSPAAIFTIYPSVTDRIKATGNVLVATTPTSYDPFVGVDKQGQYQGFELKLVDWLMPRIAEKLQLKQPPTPKIIEVPWNRLFAYMQNGEADISVRSLTRSEQRERQYQNLKFTTGYVVNHQIFIQLKNDGVYPDSLKGRIVGAKSRSMNETVAKFLAPKFGYQVNSSYTAYGDLFEGLRRGDIAYAVVDSLLVNEHLNKSVYALGGSLDDELRTFYKEELGFDHEEYSVMVHEGGSSELRTALNEILESTEYKTFADRMKVEQAAK